MRLLLVNNPLPTHNRVGEVLLNKLLRIVENVADDIDLVVANLPEIPHSTSRIVNLADWPLDNRKGNVLVKILRHMMVQLRYAIAVLRAPQPEVAVFWIGGRRLLAPLAVSRLRGIPSLVFGTTAYSRAGLSERYGRFGALLEKGLTILERLSPPLSSYMFVESPGCIRSDGLDELASKGRVLVQHLWIEPGSGPVHVRKPSDHIRIGYIGRLIPGKGVVELVRAVKYLHGQRHAWSLAIAGSGPLEPEVLSERGDDEGIELMGWLDRDGVAGLLMCLDLLVLPTEQEGLPNVIIEAMAEGVPVLATPVGGIPDLIRDCETGFLMADNRVDTIAEALARVCSRPDLQLIGRAGFEFVREHYSLESARHLFKENLKTILSSAIDEDH